MAKRFKPCSVDGCNGNANHTARGRRGFCREHYERWQRHGDPLAGRTSPGPPRLCAVEGCDGDARSGGFCSKHYQRFHHHGDPLVALNVKHGMYRTRLYQTWQNMLRRCGHYRGANPQDIKNYFAKGIRVCQPWLEFTVFAEWARSSGYADDKTIDRIDSDGNYEPGNCRWLTQRENSRARKGNKLNIEAARQIREMRRKGVPRGEVARKFGVSGSLVSGIEAGVKWAE